jgi:hypothetical protein
MNSITSESLVDILFQLTWNSNEARHVDMYHAARVNLWRDILPPFLSDALLGKQIGDRVNLTLPSGEVVPGLSDDNRFSVKSAQFDRSHKVFGPLEPRMGRYYPRGILKGLAGVYPESILPFRVVGVNNGDLNVDFNHSLSGKDLKLAATIGQVHSKPAERGGTSVDWMEALADGPGMQTRWNGTQTDYFSDNPFERIDTSPDGRFYDKPRFVQHIDDAAIEVIQSLYGQHLESGMRVLDLMSSWQSHIPDGKNLERVAGLGMNEAELKRNPMLSDVHVHDLNLNPVLPFEPDTFDAVVCTVSIEYLVNPVEVFRSVAEVLRKEGLFIITFSNRWFPTKAIKLWQEVHDFERMGIVLEYFIQSGRFDTLQTYTFRGLPRPVNDKYFPKLRYADPVYAVWGKKIT